MFTISITWLGPSAIWGSGGTSANGLFPELRPAKLDTTAGGASRPAAAFGNGVGGGGVLSGRSALLSQSKGPSKKHPGRVGGTNNLPSNKNPGNCAVTRSPTASRTVRRPGQNRGTSDSGLGREC